MKREIIAYKGYFKEFFENLDAGTQDKILYVLMLLQTQDRIPLKFMRLIEEGLYELRIEYQSNIYRIFFCFDEGRIVILFNGFQKKTEKTQPSFFYFSPHFQISPPIEADFRKYLLSLMCKRSKESDMDNLMRKLPIGIQTFEDIRRKNILL